MKCLALVNLLKPLSRLSAILLLSVSALHAQQTGISGRVLDAQGATIPNAAVEVKKVGGASFTTKTGGEGTYLIPSLTAGDYLVTVSAPGFTTVQTKVTMLVGQTPDVDTTRLSAEPPMRLS